MQSFFKQIDTDFARCMNGLKRMIRFFKGVMSPGRSWRSGAFSRSKVMMRTDLQIGPMSSTSGRPVGISIA
jgi:hypothetical protein